jgi:hypothetical protein
MAIVYVVIENGELYPILYKTYESALPPFGRLLWSLRDQYREAVITKYEDELSAERGEVEEMDYGMASDVDIDENETGTTQLYIEKGIHIIIQRYAVP